jgi:hypothetical protein
MEYKTDEECIKIFNELKFQKLSRYVVYELSKEGGTEHFVKLGFIGVENRQGGSSKLHLG